MSCVIFIRSSGASQVGGKADILIRSYTATLQRAACFGFMRFCLPFPIATWGSWNDQTPNFKMETSTPPFSCSLSAELHSELNLQASQLFQTLWSTKVETCEESGWLHLPSPSTHSHYPCSVTCWGGGQDSGGLAVWTRLLQRISDSEEDLLTYGVMPPELKAEGLCCVRWLMSGGVGRFSSRCWPPKWKRCPVCPHDENKRCHSEKVAIFRHICCIATDDSCPRL